ncbi:MAG: hypothetical protein H0W69_07255 [Gemmatimonadaceae bacterium]|nr:hypothetical protein [Gemmatimonadaceae bacterium]
MTDTINSALPRESGALQLIGLIVRHLRSLIGFAVVFGALGIAMAVARPRTYSSLASFVPQQYNSDRTGLGTVAASFGLSVSGTGQTESPQFYVDLLTSNEILRRLASATYTFSSPSRTTTLPKFLHLEQPDTAMMMVKTVEVLRRMIAAKPNLRTGVVSVTVTSRWPDLSAQLADSLLSSINTFNLASRQSRATSERTFVEGRLRTYEADLRVAEAEYENFLSSNQQTSSPALQLQQDRMRRKISMLQQVVTSLTSANEQAKIDEVRNTPAIKPIELPRPSPMPNGRNTLRSGALAAVGGMLFALLLAVIRERLKFAADRDDPSLNQLRGYIRRIPLGRLLVGRA